MSEVRDYEVVQECLKGNVQEYEKIVDRYQKILFNTTLNMVNDYDDAQDITQAVFIKAFENLKNYKPEFRFYSWIYRIMINETLNWKKKNQTYSELDQNIVSSSKNPEEQFLSNRLSEKVQDAVANLMIDHRVIIVLKHFVALPYSDISYILDIPEKTVKSRLFSARQKLSVILSSSELN